MFALLKSNAPIKGASKIALTRGNPAWPFVAEVHGDTVAGPSVKLIPGRSVVEALAQHGLELADDIGEELKIEFAIEKQSIAEMVSMREKETVIDGRTVIFSMNALSLKDGLYRGVLTFTPCLPYSGRDRFNYQSLERLNVVHASTEDQPDERLGGGDQNDHGDGIAGDQSQ